MIVSRVVSDLRLLRLQNKLQSYTASSVVCPHVHNPHKLKFAAHLAMARVSLLLCVLVGVLAITVGAWFGVERVLFSTPLTHYEVCVMSKCVLVHPAL